MGFQFFRIENHFKMYNGPGKIEGVTFEDLPVIMKELGSRPFVPGRSPWEMWVWDCGSSKILENNSHKNSQKKIFVFRIHHSMADGYSILKLLISDMTGMKMEDVYALSKSQDRDDQGEKNFWKKLTDLFWFMVKAPFEMADMIVQAWDFNDWHIPEEKLTGRLNSALSEPIPVEFVKKIKKIYGCSFHTVIQAAVTGGMRNFFIDQNIKIPKSGNMNCLLPLPVNRNRTKLRNQMLAAMAPIPVQISDPADRIRCIETSLNKLRYSTAPLACFYLIPLTGALPAVVIKKMAKQLTTTCLFSNFPGPARPVLFADQTLLEDICFGAGLLVGNLGIGVNVQSYNGIIRIWICADEAILKDPNLVKILLNKSEQELEILRDCHIGSPLT